MLEYDIYINEGRENLSVNKKTITVNPVVDIISPRELMRELKSRNPLYNEQIIRNVMDNFFAMLLDMMADGHAISMKDDNGTLATFYADVEIAGGSIDLERACELCPDIQDITPENAREIVAQAGVTVRPRIRCTKHFHTALRDKKPEPVARNVIVREKDKNKKK